MDGRQHRVFTNARGETVVYDGVSPVDWRVAVYVLVGRAGRLLMLTKAFSGWFELPGGAVQPDEALLEGAARECLEETGYCFTAEGFAPVHAAEQWFYHRGARTYHHSLLYVVRGAVTGERVPGWRPERGRPDPVRWVDPANLTAATTNATHWRALVKAGIVADEGGAP